MMKIGYTRPVYTCYAFHLYECTMKYAMNMKATNNRIR